MPLRVRELLFIQKLRQFLATNILKNQLRLNVRNFLLAKSLHIRLVMMLQPHGNQCLQSNAQRCRIDLRFESGQHA